MNKHKTLYWMIGVALVNSQTVWAEEHDEVAKLSTMVVSSKRATELEKLDAETKIISKEVIDKANIYSIDQLDGKAPGLVVRQRGARIYDNISLRGQTSMDFYSPKVLVFVDGLPQDSGSFAQALPIGLRQVEVLNGPQGTLYGRGAVGGVINVVTEKPGEGNEMTLSTSQSNLTQGVSGRINQTLIEDSLFLDVSGHYLDEDGEYEGLLSGEDLGDSLNKQGQARLRWAPSQSQWDVMLSLRHDDIYSNEEQFVPAGFFRARKAYPVEGDYQLRLDSYGLTTSYDFESVQFTSLTSYQGRDLNRTVFSLYSPETYDSFSQEIRIASQPDESTRMSYVAGFYYEDTDFTFARPTLMQKTKHTMESYALFGEMTWALTENLDLTTGLRLDRNEVAATSEAMTFIQKGNDTFHSISPKLALGYQLTPATRLYALYSEGSKSGGFTRTGTPATVSFSYKPEKTRNYEAGIKTRLLDERLTLSAATYFTETKDYQLFIGFQPNQYLANVGETEVKGIHLDAEIAVTDRFMISGMWSYNTAEFSKSKVIGNDLKGNWTPYVPRSTASVGAVYKIDIAPEWGSLTLNSDISHVGKMYFDQENQLSQSAYTLLNASVGWQLTQNLSMDLYGANLTDKDYAVYLFDAGPGLGQFFQLGRGREVGLKLTVGF
ncbi:TonB-dependent receptor [Methylophaga nitratireducenticrescens]|uniref:TonB-dependent receptor n=1 Tax=Methylophaga nitratireducenticrescens TaxID=754476 RepID=I1XF70_METNJ|nr:TonB-dependent receptor [Methylophaga nitratireducenticrescens]AFI83039.1 TonB-dependent receptor [Methylophaga nitratireducenticrescens]